ncbi:MULTISPECIES: protocatechuate 3,4-dioxygenase subunit alpha [unclassified Lysobacter]|uniref:protocatechuate 3,4-dioxygenase subunit alpha n=1 Tax=unclassified Lysobacter TaxID=2635362 RepID=UPI001BE8D228|nr:MULTISPECIES: protocatechuate 3,4-dioxygenase subunit alpha [unclassified Lysobacter]MBT2748858.1 protocatechuate 3,4-dioxygenase subunit alpha [Lysobacter sp. ISL-42]MBT2751095.1 protocatechuate 3,4-dioxygenase subunit alpha [Lysobacter sp. ISL-50]MBT2779641.1 protocatechuate 3,4-dioxygenase subunit alpha [Lysobacter sp. ISL-54]MBT2783411.1 protocatechuate 3,4-dioxygenase subunit alpha [Lysobacter sp. ISL-52]
MSFRQTASQTVGPYFIIGLGAGVRTDLSEGAQGQRVVVHGRVFDGEGAPVGDALIETWQACARGHYAHLDDPGASAAGAGFEGFARVPTDAEGGFRLITIKPGRVAGADGRPQAPHLLVNVLMRGLLKQAVTRLYFGDEAQANAEDEVLARVPAERRATLISRIQADGSHRWDIHMQGERETAFFSF